MAVVRSLYVDDLTDEFLECRGYNHNFRRQNDYNIVFSAAGNVTEFTRHDLCRTCKSERHMTIDGRSFATKKIRYKYPDGYLLTKTTGRRSQRTVKREARAVQFSRIAPPRRRASRARTRKKAA